eukprot:scaffold1419_cov410-Prasinococcus_capsulatus_cf.AAC.13
MVSEQEYMVAVTETLKTQFGLDYTVYSMFEKHPGYILCYTTPEFDQGCADADPTVVHCAGPSFPRLEYDYDRLDNTADINDAIFVEDLKGFPLQRLKERKEAGDTIIYCSMGTLTGMGTLHVVRDKQWQPSPMRLSVGFYVCLPAGPPCPFYSSDEIHGHRSTL